MDLKQYQQWTRTTAVYPGANEQGFAEVNYLVLGLASESGEVAGKLKKIIRGDKINPEDFVSEISDVLWYLTRICDNVGITLENLADYNHAKLEARKATNTIKGSGETVESRIITDNA